jgi:hypothetical protein
MYALVAIEDNVIGEEFYVGIGVSTAGSAVRSREHVKNVETV